jgi:hypothetical protein
LIFFICVFLWDKSLVLLYIINMVGKIEKTKDERRKTKDVEGKFLSRT